MKKITTNEDDVFLNDWIEGKINDNQLKEKVSPEDFIIYKKIKKSISLLNDFNEPLDNMLLKVKNNKIKLSQNKPKKVKVINLYTKWAISIAASILIIFGAINLLSNPTVLIENNLGGQEEFALLDGSQVILNDNSTLEYNKDDWKKSRELKLTGEAYFKVKKGSTFLVNTKFGTVTVIGTQFIVNVKNNNLDVICYEGKVKVSNQYNTHFLTPGEAVILNGEKMKNRTVNATAPSWVSGEFYFNKTPLKEVIDTLEEQFNIEFDRSNINQTTIFTGSFNNKNLKIALASVFKPMNIKYKSVNNKIILTEN